MIVSVNAFSPSPLGGITTKRSSLLELREQQQQQSGGGKSGGFSLSNLFGGNKEDGGVTSTLRGSSSNKLEPHPSVRKHISPLNRLGPDPQVQPQSEPLPIHPDVRSGTLPNGLPYVILPNKSPPGRFEAHLQVFSGSGTSSDVCMVMPISRSLCGCGWVCTMGLRLSKGKLLTFWILKKNLEQLMNSSHNKGLLTWLNTLHTWDPENGNFYLELDHKPMVSSV
jgi:hypothetical protein